MGNVFHVSRLFANTFCSSRREKKEGKKKKEKVKKALQADDIKKNDIHTKGEWCQAQRTYLEQPAVLQGKPFSHTVCRRQRVGSLSLKVQKQHKK